jgi:hypothetical protein
VDFEKVDAFVQRLNGSSSWWAVFFFFFMSYICISVIV